MNPQGLNLSELPGEFCQNFCRALLRCTSNVCRRISEFQPKHDIFLSHSGQEKAFVEQLYHDLKRMNQRPFFDQESNCLPKAQKSAPEIIEAAEQCRVGVVVVSEGCLTSKWPMLELSRFVECGVKLFPLFFKLSPSDPKGNEVEANLAKVG